MMYEYYNPQYHKIEDEADTTSIASIMAVGACGSYFYALERTIKKIDAYFNMEQIKRERENTSVLPSTTHDLDFTAEKKSQYDEYNKIYNSIKWKEIAQWGACAVGCGFFTFSLI